jgi:Putative transposase
MVLHTLQHHPHVHCVVPGGGPSLDGTRWVACRSGFFLPARQAKSHIETESSADFVPRFRLMHATPADIPRTTIVQCNWDFRWKGATAPPNCKPEQRSKADAPSAFAASDC